MATHAERNRRLRRARADGGSTRAIARKFDLSQTRVLQILDRTGGDPLASTQTRELQAATTMELDSEQARLRNRIASDRRRLRAVQDELSARATDRILGLGN